MNQYVAPELDCAICLQKCHHPTKLPCGHIFCFLCVKGVAIQSKKCAMCRSPIPINYLDSPVLLENVQSVAILEGSTPGYQWYYEGRNGWWRYDERSNSELETSYVEGNTDCKLLLAGTIYCINFQTMMQIRRNDPTRRRRVRRDTPSLPAKGVAGIKGPDYNMQRDKSEEASPSYVTTETNGIIEILDDDGVPSDNVETNISTSNEFTDVINSLSSINIQDLDSRSSEDSG